MIFRFCAFLLCTVGLAAGCAGAPSSRRKAEDPAKILFGDQPDFEKSRAFQKILAREPGTPAYEEAKIDYLLERLAGSPYNFIRNEGGHSGMRAVTHLRWKYMRFYHEVKTAEDFIERIASLSRITGQRYLIQIREGEVYPSREVFYNELHLLEDALKARSALSVGTREA